LDIGFLDAVLITVGVAFNMQVITVKLWWLKVCRYSNSGGQGKKKKPG
jgi:hypothetical protein